MEAEKSLTEKESLDLITRMINQAKDSYRDTGTAAIMWGIIITICSLVRLAEIQFTFKMPFDIYWITFLAVIPQIWISIREKKKRRVKTYDEIYMDYVWFGFGISIFLMIFILNVLFNSLNSVNTLPGKSAISVLYEFIAPLFLLLYGLPTFITGAACKFRPMLFGGLFCWACCIITIFTPIKIDLLLTAASAIFAWLIPGMIMQKDYLSAKTELAKSYV